jgi:uncharacterized protein (TIGR02266 family)
MSAAAKRKELPEGPRMEARFKRLDSADDDQQQRRSDGRYGVDLDVSLGSDHNFYAGLAENLSGGGIFVATHMLRPVGSVIELSIHLPDSSAPVKGMGEVRWIREYNESSELPPGMGIRFTHLEAGSLTAIERFLAKRDPLFFDDD